MFDVAVIGGGITGAAIAYYLSKYKVSCCVLEKENDVAMGTTRANSGIVHAGYDPEPDTLMARLNVRGNLLTEQLCSKYNVPFKKTGSIVIAFDDSNMEHIKKLFERGQKNGVPGLCILSSDEVLRLEPNLSRDVKGALFAPTGAVVNPWRLCLALCETAAWNGVEFFTDFAVDSIKKTRSGFAITAGDKQVEARYAVNAAGLFADRIAELAGCADFSVTASKGQYYLLDKTQKGLVNTVVFQCPTKLGKGVLVSPTADGNIIVGPNAESNNVKEDLSTDREGLAYVSREAAKSVPNINYRDNIRCFAGLRANSTDSDFIIRESNVPGFFHAAGIKSPGLSSAPAIGEYMTELLEKSGLLLEKKENFVEPRFPKPFSEMTPEEKKAACARDPRYGNVVCRCNTVTEAEIAFALEMKLSAVTIDGVKRRVGTGMGRCQGGFCGPRVHELICRHRGVDRESVFADRNGSYIVVGKTGEQK